MNRKSLASRAAELGTDQATLVRALKALCAWHILSDGWYRPKKTVMSLEQAAKTLGVTTKSAQDAIAASYPKHWTREMILAAIFAFMKKEGRWPHHNELRRKNGLPSPWTWDMHANARFTTYSSPIGSWTGYWTRNNNWVRPRDYWERQVAADRRCGPMMAIQLRNVLARKEAIERIGFEKFIKEGIAEVIDEHVEYGTLYRLPGETPSEPMVLLKVVNSTPEPDGSFSDYYLRVPPNMTDVREALKWTFNGNEALGSQPYRPLVET